MYIVFDTETNGLPKNWKAPMTELDNWPRVIQLAWAFYSENGSLMAHNVCLIKPDGWTIPVEKFWIENGYSTEKNMQLGVPMRRALEMMIEYMNKSQIVIAHNMAFDHNIVGAEMLRYGVRPSNKLERFCTMKNTTNLLKLPGPYGYKWPTLTELHQFLFGTGFEGAHDAMNDVEACAKCFFELRKRDLEQPII